MTNEEMERALEFLVKSQAAFDARQAAFEERQAAYEERQAAYEERQAALDARFEHTDQQIAEMGRQVQIQAETQTEFIQIVTRTLEAQAEINASLRAACARADERGNRTDERLDRLAATVERHITGGNGSA
jgi:hypothetical protein